MRKTTNQLVWTTALALGVLAAVLTGCRSRSGQPPVAASPPAVSPAAASPADLNVTTDLALLVSVRPTDSTDDTAWTKLVETPGTITVPAGQVLKIEARDKDTFGDAEAAQLAKDFAGLASVAGLMSLRCLNVGGTQVTDAGLAHLAKLTSLRELYLGGPGLTDAGLAHLAGLTSLEKLYLLSTRITDAGVEHLAKLRSLRWLYLGGTKVTDTGIATLKQALPDVEITR